MQSVNNLAKRMMTADEREYLRLEQEKAERAKLPMNPEKDAQEYERLEAEKKQRGAVSGYGVPRKDFSHTPVLPKQEIPSDLPDSIKQWLEEKKDA